jgi:hypothetical protein
MGHLWQGFSREQLAAWLEDAGFSSVRYVPLTPDPAAKGPALFAATARVATVGGKREAGSDGGTSTAGRRRKRSRSRLNASSLRQ